MHKRNLLKTFTAFVMSLAYGKDIASEEPTKTKLTIVHKTPLTPQQLLKRKRAKVAKRSRKINRAH